MKHAETHPTLDVEGCFGCKVASTSFGSNSTTTRGAAVANTNNTERGWQKDMPAYKRLRANGLQPRQIDGCAEIERRATTAEQVETGRVA
jgi:hypothetical protein